MKKAFLLIPFALIIMMLFPAGVSARTAEPHDTVYLYKSWTNMFDMEPYVYLPVPKLVNVTADTPYKVYIDIRNGNTFGGNKYINSCVAATLGDSIWLINSEYLQREFKGDANKLNAYVPFFFNDKVAFAVCVAMPSVKELLLGTSENAPISVDYYYIDFKKREVIRVTPKVLSGLLEDYHDLQMRYEGMKDYKKREIIQDYFYMFVDRATDDIMRPYILDLTN